MYGMLGGSITRWAMQLSVGSSKQEAEVESLALLVDIYEVSILRMGLTSFLSATPPFTLSQSLHAY